MRVAVIGNVDAGKSTLLGVLTHCALDNGRGSARQKLLRHKHEKETGRTSSVGNQIIGFDSVGKITNQPTHGTQINWNKICTESSKIINFYDLAGHEKYFKTTVFGLMGNAPDFCLLAVGSNAGVNGMAREHLGLAIALNLPVLCVVTKIDQTSPNIIKETLSGLGKLLKSNGVRKIPLLVQEEKHAGWFIDRYDILVFIKIRSSLYAESGSLYLVFPLLVHWSQILSFGTRNFIKSLF